MTVLRARGVEKTFQEGRGEVVPVLRGIDFEVDRGEIVSLEGPSGSGKTTLLSIMGCILSPTSGTLEIAGEAVGAGSDDRLRDVRRRSIGFVFQQYNLFPALTAQENVEYALNVKGLTGEAAETRARQALERVGLGDRLSFLPRDLSGGQKQRVAVARAIASRPRILLADEPTANLDTATGTEILALFRDLAKTERTGLVIVTHDHKVRAVADRVVGIRDGRLAEAA